MKLRYSYHSEHHATPTDRWVHFVLFIGAILLLLASGQQWFLYFTDWHATDDGHSNNHLLLAVVYLLFGGALALVGYRHERASRGVSDRYVRVDEDTLRWSLTQRAEESCVTVAEIAAVDQPNIRDLRITLTNGETVVLPIYLITSPAKREELVRTLTPSA